MDGNGYFDRWEIYLGDDPIPKRVSTVRDEKAESMDFDLNVLSDRYTKEILPEAIAANQKFIDAMSNVYEFNIPEDLRYAINTGSDNFRRYAQDIVRELQYQAFRKEATEQAHQILRSQEMNDLRRIKETEINGTKNSHTAWMLLRTLSELDSAYGQGEYNKASTLLNDIAKLREILE